MKIAFYGNIANNFYVIGKALRKYSDIDVHLYLGDNIDMVQSPESEDPSIKNNYPSWIHKNKNWDISGALFFWRTNIVKELSKYDVVVLSGRGVILAALLKNKTVFFVTGSDLTLIPFYKRFNLLYAKDTNPLKSLAGQILQRSGIRRVKEIWTQPFSPFVNALNKLHIKDDRIKSKYFPIIVDSKLFSMDPDAHQSTDKNMRSILDHFKFVVFHPSRIMINAHPELQDAGQWKQNDLLMRAFARFIKEENALDAVLVMPDRTASPDVDHAKALIKELAIEKNVLWIKADHPFGFTRHELIKFYSIADVVADDFGIGWFGSVVLEGFSIGKPVLSFVDEIVMQKLYPWHPFLSSNTEKGNAELLKKLYHDRDFAKQQGTLGRKWIEEFHSEDSASKKYVDQFQKIVR